MNRIPLFLPAAVLALLAACSNYDDPDFSVRTQPTPLQVVLPAAVAQAGAGWAHTCAVLADGTLQCWGANTYGQLGNGGAGVPCVEGYSICSNGPVAVSAPPAAWSRVSGGLRGTCGIDSAQAAHCWGEGRAGQLGQGAQASSKVPVAVAGGLTFNLLSSNTGADLSCALSGSDLYCWGAGARGQPGTGAVSQVATSPYRVAATQAFAAVTVGELHACALDSNSLALCWGANGAGQLGDGTQTDRTTPTATLGGQTYTQIVAGLAHTCALDGTGVAFCWGTAEQIGRATTTAAERATPAAVAGAQRFVQIAAGGWHTCGLESGGQLWCWGDNSAAQFGDGGTTSSLEPVAITGVPLFTQLVAGGGHTCGVTAAGEMHCWGANSYGQSGRLPD
jgi:alpha-tubulin suppressor-like RCC1 family protein